MSGNKIIFLLIVLWPLTGNLACVRDVVPDDSFLPGHRVFETATVSWEELALLPGILYESSGLVVTAPDRIWSHNDSGHSNELFQVNTSGSLLRTLVVSNAINVDWEDLALDIYGRVYISDAGNNNNDRQDLVIYRIPLPETIAGNTVQAEKIFFQFEDQARFPPPAARRNFDVEALIWKDDSLFLFTKDRSSPFTGYTKLYVLPAQPGSHQARLVDSLYVDGSTQQARITAADLNFETGELVLLTRSRILSFTQYPGNRFFDGRIIDYQFSQQPGQAEAIGFAGPRLLYMTEEGTNVNNPGWLYRIILPN